MNKKLRICLLTTLVLLLPAFALAGEHTDLIDKVLHKSGFFEQVRDIPQEMKDGMRDEVQNLPITEKQLQEMLRLVDEFMDPEVIISDVREKLRNVLNDDEAQELINWYESDLGSRITMAEVEGGSSGMLDELVEQAARLMADEDRVAFARRLNELIGNDQLMGAMAENIQLATFIITASVFSPGEPINLHFVKAQLAALRAHMRPSLEDLVLLVSIADYQDFSLEELELYLEFLESPPATKFLKILLDGLMEGTAHYVSLLEEYTKSLQPAKRQVPRGVF